MSLHLFPQPLHINRLPNHYIYDIYPDIKVHGANMGPIWGRQDPGGPHVGPMNLAIWVSLLRPFTTSWLLEIPPLWYVTFSPWLAKLFWGNIKNIFAFSVISQHWDGTRSVNPSSWMIRTHVSCMVSTMAADDLAAQGARASAAMVLI